MGNSLGIAKNEKKHSELALMTVSLNEKCKSRSNSCKS